MKEKSNKPNTGREPDRFYIGLLVGGFFLIALIAFLANRFINAFDTKLINDAAFASAKREAAAKIAAENKPDSTDTEESDLELNPYDGIITEGEDSQGKYIEIEKGGVKVRIYEDGTIVDTGAIESAGCMEGLTEEECAARYADLAKQHIVYVVKKGDTLSGVSGENGASVESIAKYNQIEDINLIYAGESLVIPSQSKLNQIFNGEDDGVLSEEEKIAAINGDDINESDNVEDDVIDATMGK